MRQHFPSVHPFASEEEFRSTEDTVRKFQSGVGKELHQKLLQRAKSRRNWVCIVVLNQFLSFFTHGCVLLSWLLSVFTPSWRTGGWTVPTWRSASPLSSMWILPGQHPTWNTAGPLLRARSWRGPVSAPGTRCSTGIWSARKSCTLLKALKSV